MVLDVGCGSGQCTNLLAPYFDRVVGTDVSVAQIAAAQSNQHAPNVQFKYIVIEKFLLKIRIYITFCC